jgi:phosphoribosylformylglycinamidine synthase
MNTVKVLVITGFGINCEEELAAAYRLAGAESKIVHLNDLLNGEISIHNFMVINFPGGFSFGDDIASGKVLANKIKYKKLPSGKTLLDELIAFIAEKKLIVGICNGFQVLTRLGLLPNLSGKFEQEMTLTNNAGGTFIDDWCTLSVTNHHSPLLKGIRQMEVPIRHGEGRLVFRDEATRNTVRDLQLNCLSYVDNPNGAELDCAGLVDKTGQVIGLMPHPEAFLTLYNHPDWPRRKALGVGNEDGEGLQFFRNIVACVKESQRV